MAALRGSQADPESTRRLILETAEELFAEFGVAATSVRAIHRKSGLALGAVHYHFGSKQGVVRALVSQDWVDLGGPVRQLADSLSARSRSPGLGDVVSVLAEPYLDLVRREPVRGSRYLRIIAELTRTGEQALLEAAADTTRAVLVVFMRAEPRLDMDQAQTCMALAARTLMLLIADLEDRSEPNLRAIVAFVEGGLRAIVARTLDLTEKA